MSIILLMLISYLAGSIPTGKIVGHVYGVDIQKRGSGNIGFANVRRILGWRAGITTLFIDIVKGFIPTLLAVHFLTPAAAYFVGLAAIGGHVFSVWLGFTGGKGIATGLGVVLCLYPLAAVIGASVYVLVGLLGYKSSAASLLGLAVAVVSIAILTPPAWWQAAVLLAIALWTLRHNLAGTVKNYELDSARS